MNRQSFDTNTTNGLLHFRDFLNTLIAYNVDKDEEYYNDIHIYQEESLIIIEWDSVPYSHEWGGQFKYVDSDEAVLKEVIFPDNHCEWLFPDTVDEELREWHKEHPGWVKTSFGTWINEEENERFRAELARLAGEEFQKDL